MACARVSRSASLVLRSGTCSVSRSCCGRVASFLCGWSAASAEGESAIWRPPGFSTYASFAIPSSEDGPFASVLDVDEEGGEDAEQQLAFSATKIKDVPRVKDYWQSCYGIFLVGLSLYEEGEKKPCVGERASHSVADGYAYLSFEDVDATVRLLGSGFVSLLKDGGIQVESFADEERNGGKFANVGILLQSRKEWLFTDLAISAYPPLTSVTLHYTFPLEHVKAIAEHSSKEGSQLRRWSDESSLMPRGHWVAMPGRVHLRIPGVCSCARG